jgi:hypothetical protein
MGSESGARVGQWWETEGDCVYQYKQSFRDGWARVVRATATINY